MIETASTSCPACGHSNPVQNRFCGQCGIALSLVCSSCGAANPAGGRFCGSCGASIAGAAPGMPLRAPPVSPAAESAEDQERRLVTIMFADLAGSTMLGERLDPEEVSELVSSVQERLTVTVKRYGGHIAKYLGDGLMALFGAPIAHEDDGERAVLAGLEMQRALIHFNASRSEGTDRVLLRVGITSGEVVAGPIAGSYDVIGDAANTAARLQSAAEIGEVLVGDETMVLAQRRIYFGEPRDLHLKGKAGIVRAYPALRVRERIAERWETGRPPTPCIGRERELSLMIETWQRARAGEGQLVTIIAEPGVGKSRLLAEVAERIAAMGDVREVRGRCLSYGQGISLWLVTDLVRNLCDIGEQDQDDLVRLRLRETVEQALGEQDEETRAAALDVLGQMLGLPVGHSLVAQSEAQVRHQVLIRSLSLLLRSLSEARPTMIVLEDLHWIDTASQEVLAEVLSGVPQLQMLVLVSQRPGWSAPWSQWSWPERLVLRPLDEHDALALATAVLGGRHPSHELERYVTERAAGNPFFVEELLHALREAGGLNQEGGYVELVASVAEGLPSTLSEVLLARLDRLERQVRGVAQVASVIGRNFALRLLEEVTGQELPTLETQLAALQQAEIVYPADTFGREFLFKHAVIRDVAYNTLLQRRRQRLHQATARALTDLFPGEEYIESIAYHYNQSQDHAMAALWLERAGDRAARMYANRSAIEHYEAARARLFAAHADHASLGRLDEKLGGVLKTSGQYDAALEVLDRAAASYAAMSDLEAQARVTDLMGTVHTERGSASEGEARIRHLLETATGQHVSPALAGLYVTLARMRFYTGKLDEIVEVAEQASELGRALGSDSILVRAETWRGMGLMLLGRLDEAQDVIEDLLPLAETVADPSTLAYALSIVAHTRLQTGDLETSIGARQRELEIVRRMGDPVRTGYALGQLGEALFFRGDWDEARALLEEGKRQLRSLGSSWASIFPILNLGWLCMEEGRWDEASTLLEKTMAAATQSRDQLVLRRARALWAEHELMVGNGETARELVQSLLDSPGSEEMILGTRLLFLLAWAHLQTGNLDHAEANAATAVGRARKLGQRMMLLDALRIQGMVFAQQGRWNEAYQVLDEAVASARTAHNPYAEARALYEWGRLCLQCGNAEQSRSLLEAAREILHRLGARPYIERVEQALTAIDTRRLA